MRLVTRLDFCKRLGKVVGNEAVKPLSPGTSFVVRGQESPQSGRLMRIRRHQETIAHRLFRAEILEYFGLKYISFIKPPGDTYLISKYKPIVAVIAPAKRSHRPL